MPDNDSPYQDPPMLKAALEYASRGWHVFPVEPRGKRPLKGFKWGAEATIDLETVRQWWTREPNANIGIACGPSGLVVCDIDSAVGEQAVEHSGGLPESLVVRTGKGRHIYLSGEATSVNGIMEGVDRKSLGGYVVAPPSVHESGRVYEFEDPDVEVAEAPEWFTALSKHKKTASGNHPEIPDSSSGRPGAAGASVEAGSRNEFLSNRAYAMRRSGMEPEEITPALLEINRARCNPPLDSSEVEQIALGKRRVSPEYHDYDPDAEMPDNTGTGTDLWFARRFAREHGANLKYVWEWKTWVAWQPHEGRWKRDAGSIAYSSAKVTVRRILAEAATAGEDEGKRLLKAAHRFMGASAIDCALRLARSEESILARTDTWDQHPHLLNCSNGTVDLQNGELRPHSRSDMLTKTTGVEYLQDATSPVFEAFLARILPDDDLRAYIQRAIGYSAVGKVSEHLLHVAHGGGANGKSVLFGAAGSALGEYSVNVPVDLLLEKHHAEHPTLLTTLRGARLALCSETPEGGKFNEARLKMLTGGDAIPARGMRENWYEFEPSHTLWLATNHRPRAKETTLAFWRRMRLLPFTVSIPADEQDRDLPEKLESDLSAILGWIVAGAVQWFKVGLEPPKSVTAATEDYRADEDELREFVELYQVGVGWTSTKEIHKHYLEWAEEAGIGKPVRQQTLTRRLKERGWEYCKPAGSPRGFRCAPRFERGSHIDSNVESTRGTHTKLPAISGEQRGGGSTGLFQRGQNHEQAGSATNGTKKPDYTDEELSDMADREADSSHG